MRCSVITLIALFVVACTAPSAPGDVDVRGKITLSPRPTQSQPDTVSEHSPSPVSSLPPQPTAPENTTIDSRITVEAEDPSRVNVSEEVPELVDLTTSPRVFSIQFMDASQKDATISIPIADPSDTYTLSRSLREQAHGPPLWQKTAQPVIRDPAANIVRVCIRQTDQEKKRYLIAGRERIDIPEDASYALGDPSATDSITQEFNTDETPPSQSVQGLVWIRIPAEEQIKGDKAILCLVHGAGSERFEPWYLWQEYADFLTSDGQVKAEVSRTYIVVLFRYDSRRSPDENAKNLRREIMRQYGPRIVILVGHSMGGHLARAAYAQEYPDGGYAGIVTTATAHNGSPLAVPDLMYRTIADLPHPTAAMLMYTLALSNTQGGIRPVGFLPRMREFVEEVKLHNDGLLSQAAFESEFGIPSLPFSIQFAIGKYASSPLRGEVSERSNLVMPEASCELCRIPEVVAAGIRTRVINGRRYCNYIEALQRFEEIKGCARVPHVIAHAGYLTGEKTFERAQTLFRNGSTSRGMALLANDLSYETGQSFLAWTWSGLFQAIPTATGRKSFWGDGFVRLQDALGLLPGDPIDQAGSTEKKPLPDGAAIRRRLPPWIKSATWWEDFSHLDMASGQKGANRNYFATLLADANTFEQEARIRQATAIGPVEKSEISSRIRERYASDQEYSQHEIGSDGSFTRYYKAKLDETSLAFTDVREPDKLVTYRVRITFRVRYWSWRASDTDFENLPIDQDEFTRYTIEISRIGNRWCFRR